MATNSRVNTKNKTKKNLKKRRKIKVGVVSIFLVLLVLIVSIIVGILSKRITNIYISGNSYLNDQQIIEIAKLENYPSTIKNLGVIIEKRLEKNVLIKKADVKKKGLTKVYIEVSENNPLFFNSTSNETILSDGSKVTDKIECPTLVNYVPDTIYSNFITKMKGINREILNRTSEIIYDPNDVDTERFLFVMDDSNYVYLTLSKFESINNYISIVKEFESKKGILYLDSGEYFKVLDN